MPGGESAVHALLGAGLFHVCMLMLLQVDAAEKERVRQVQNLKQQSTHFLEQKAQDIFNLKSQLTQMRTQHELEVRRVQFRVNIRHTIPDLQPQVPATQVAADADAHAA